MGRPAPAPQQTIVESLPTTTSDGFVMLDGETHYRISDYQRLKPFLASIPSDSDLWMFITSGGGLTAGRVDSAGSLFPYQTVDQLHDAHHHTGPLTLVRVEQGDTDIVLWEPFATTSAEPAAVERNLYKNTTGNRIVFEEIQHELGLVFRYSWSACDEFGWVRSATLENLTDQTVQATILDGLRNVLPFGAPLSLHQQSSNLVDAYKKTEVDPATGLGVFSLTAGITDRAEAIEVLRANTVWCCGLDGFRVHLSLAAASSFRQGRVITAEDVLNGARGNYLVSCRLELAAGQATRWHLVGDTGRDHAQVAALRRRLIDNDDLDAEILSSLQRAGENLQRYVASADGLQMSGRAESSTHHFANVLFNTMRGGVFAENHELPRADFWDFLQVRNPAVAARQQVLVATLPTTVNIQDLRKWAQASGDADFERLCHEYLPLHFGRRHGDPSRPWNHFTIRVRNEAGDRALNYEGNWRDIFQNWEALATAFPGFYPNLVAKFVNASTVDGFNPYRLNRDGVDWEAPTPDDPWSNIGYWGDHQIIYLLRLLEGWQQHDPNGIAHTLAADIYSYAEVPYRIRPYADILRDPSATIAFDRERAARIAARVELNGTDGKLLTAPDGSVYHVNLLEKLLVPALAKLSNLVPDGGIWMNTQRPEWNDANNALAGGGISVVTLCHLRRYLTFLERILAQDPDQVLPVSTEVIDWFSMIAIALVSEKELLQKPALAAHDRKRLLDSLGTAFSGYRETVYAGGFSQRTDLPVSQVIAFCRTALEFIDWGLAANRRDDGLFHAYNLLKISADDSAAHIERLPLMLEGQVAAFTSEFLSPEETLTALERLYESPLYRPEERSFILYPERELPGFLAKNTVPETEVTAIPLLRDLLSVGNESLLRQDVDGTYRFHADFSNVQHLAASLDRLSRDNTWSQAVAQNREAVLALYESVFQHEAYTGRSSVMYGYEGLGCIYWHMIAKLQLAVQETLQRTEKADPSAALRKPLAQMYFRIRSGLGYEKSAAKYGAFPTDPYSHTPGSGGAKQPGMTGLVKEEILTRRGELGIRVEHGIVRFEPELLRPDEFLGQPGEFPYFDIEGKARSLKLVPGSIAFTLCQVPVIYEISGNELGIRITMADGTSTEHEGGILDAQRSAGLFARRGTIARIRVTIPETTLNRN